MSSTGNIRVNGGFENAVNMQSGSLLFVAVTGVVGLENYRAGVDGYRIAGGAWSNDHLVAEGETVPYSGAEVLYNLVAKRATPIVMHVDGDGNMHMILENNVEGWLVNTVLDNVDSENPGIAPPSTDPVDPASFTEPSLQAAIQALGTVAVPDAVTGEGMTTIDFATAAVARSSFLHLNPGELIAE